MTKCVRLCGEKRNKVIKQFYERRGEQLYERTKSGATMEVRAGKGAHVEKMTPLPVQPVWVLAEYFVWVPVVSSCLETLCSFFNVFPQMHIAQQAIEIPVSIQRSKQVPGNVRVSWLAEVITSQSTTLLSLSETHLRDHCFRLWSPNPCANGFIHSMTSISSQNSSWTKYIFTFKYGNYIDVIS